jgi:C_GCAxxG_C_C family probable redox protein
MNDPIQITRQRFEQGYSCSQSLLSGFADQFGIGEDIAIKIAAPFGGGIARQGETCGAVTGALMVLALKFGPKPGEGNDTVYNISQEFLRRFKELHRSIQCKQLINYDISQPEELLAAREAQVFHKTCPELVRSAAEIVNSMLNSTP